MENTDPLDLDPLDTDPLDPYRFETDHDSKLKFNSIY